MKIWLPLALSALFLFWWNQNEETISPPPDIAPTSPTLEKVSSFKEELPVEKEKTELLDSSDKHRRETALQKWCREPLSPRRAKDCARLFETETWRQRCREIVPADFSDFCQPIRSSTAFQCAEFLIETEASSSYPQFEACGEFSDPMEMKCLEELRPRNLRVCVGVRLDVHVTCLQTLGTLMREDCLSLDNGHGLSCLQLFEERGWAELYEVCPLVSESHEVQCLKETETTDDTFPCYPTRRAKEFGLCGKSLRVTVEAGKKTAVNVEGGVQVARGSLLLTIESGVSAEPPVEVFRAKEIRGEFDRIDGASGFGIEYRDNALLLVELKEETPAIQDLRSSRNRGLLSRELSRQLCEDRTSRRKNSH